MYQWYLSTNDIANTFNQAVKTMEWDFEKIDVSESLPPIGMGVQADSKSIAKRLFLPMSVLKALREPVMMIFDTLTAEDEQLATTDGFDGRGGGFGPGGPGGLQRQGPGGPGGGGRFGGGPTGGAPGQGRILQRR